MFTPAVVLLVVIVLAGIKAGLGFLGVIILAVGIIVEQDDRHLRRTLGWQPFWSQEDGLRLTAEWFNASADLTNGTS